MSGLGIALCIGRTLADEFRIALRERHSLLSSLYICPHTWLFILCRSLSLGCVCFRVFYINYNTSHELLQYYYDCYKDVLVLLSDCSTRLEVVCTSACLVNAMASNIGIKLKKVLPTSMLIVKSVVFDTR